MSINTVFVKQYIAEVYRQYQKGSLLSNVVSSPKRIKGAVAYFQRASKLIAQDFNRGSDVQYQNTQYEQIECVLKDKIVADIIYDLDVNKENFSEATVLASTIADALGRAVDQIIIDELDKTTTSPIGNITTPFGVEYLKIASKRLDDQSVPKDNRYLLISPAQELQLLNDDEIVNSLYKAVQLDASGNIKSAYGFNFISIEKRDEGGLPTKTSGNDKGVSGFAFHGSAVGKAIAKEVGGIEINYVPQKKGYQYDGTFTIGGKIIWNEGIVPLLSSNEIGGTTSHNKKVEQLLEALVNK